MNLPYDASNIVPEIKITPPKFRSSLIISSWFTQIWIPLAQRCLFQVLVQIGPSVLEKKSTLKCFWTDDRLTKCICIRIQNKRWKHLRRKRTDAVNNWNISTSKRQPLQRKWTTDRQTDQQREADGQQQSNISSLLRRGHIHVYYYKIIENQYWSPFSESDFKIFWNFRIPFRQDTREVDDEGKIEIIRL